jgi:hypothetical protein
MYDHVRENVFLDPSYSWANNPLKTHSDLRSITLRVVNRRYIAVDVVVSCRFDIGGDFADSKVFGERTVKVDARDYLTFVVRGFQEGHGLGSKVQCRIISVR